MSLQSSRIILRCLLGVMLAIFLSPGFAWEMTGSHAQLAHAAEKPDHRHLHEHTHTHAEANPADSEEHEHLNPHSSAGHLFSHMAVSFAAILMPDIVPPPKSIPPEPEYSVLHFQPELLYRPPREASHL